MQIQKPKQGYKLVKSLFGKYKEIPEEWNVTKLSEVGDIVGGGTPDSTKKEYWNGNIWWAIPTDITKLSGNFTDKTERTITELGLKESSAKLLPPNSILVTSRATIGECAINLVPMSTNQGFQSIICNSKNNNLFIFYAIKFHKNTLLRLAYGTTFLEISKSEMKKVEITVPELYREQQKIASILSNVDSLIQQTQKIIEHTQRLKKSFLYNLFTKGMGHEKFCTIVYGTRWMKMEIPDDWDHKKLNDVAKFRQGLQIAKVNRYRAGGGNRMKLIKILDFYDDYDESGEYIDTPSSSKQSVICNEDDIIVARTGNTLGMILTNVEGVFHNNTFALDYDRNIFLKMFFYYYLNTPQVQLFIKIISTRTGQPDLTHKEFSHLVVPIPPKKEQEKIISVISLMDSKIQEESKYNSKLVNLKKGLMQKLLTGQIRVKV